MRIFLASLLLAGCGSVKDSGAPVDAPVDVNTVDADTSGNATVSTKGALFSQSFTATVPDVDLISNLPNNMVFATGKSDAGGAASIKVFPGGSLTAAYKHPSDMGFDFVTFVGVKPGETLEFGNRNPIFTCPPAPAVCNPLLGAVTYNWSVQGGSNRTFVLGSCASASVDAPTATVARDEFPSCAHNPLDTIFLAITGTAVTGCTTRQNVAFPGPVSGGTPASAPFAVTANITGMPAEVTSVSTQFSAVIDNQFERNVNVVTGFARANGTSSGGAFTGNFQYCNIGERTAATLQMNRPGFINMRVVDSLPSSAASWTVASPQLPPFVENNGILVSPTQRRAEWVLSSTTATHDAVLMTFSWSVNIGGVFHQSFWYFILPPGTNEVTMPKLPATFDPIMPQSEFGLGFQNIRTVEIPTVSGYDAYRAQGAATALCPECAVRAGDIQRVIFSGF